MTPSITINRACRIITIGWILLVSLLAITSCSDTPQPKNTKESAEDHNDAKFPENPEERDAQYLVDAYSSGLYEIECSQHAKQKATRPDIKEFASEMIKDHSKRNESIKTAAQAKQISLQQGLTEDQMEDIKKCQDKRGPDYDETYLKKIIEDHENAIKLAEEASEKSQDTEIRNMFSTSLPLLRHHLEMAMTLKDKMNKP